VKGTSRAKLVVALDVDTEEEVGRLIRDLAHMVGMFKVGPRLFTRFGPRIFEVIQKHGSRVFYDAKLHDIPSVVSKAAGTASELGVSLITVHTLGGLAMMEAAAEEVSKKNRGTRVVGVTILTSLNSRHLREQLGIERSIPEEVVTLATLARGAGLDGVVSSPHELSDLRRLFPGEFLLVVPGIRPPGSPAADHGRYLTPREAASKGADLIVVGRPIVADDDPVKATREILKHIESAL